MKNQLLTLLVCILSFSCATNPFTGKKTMAFMPNSQLLPMAFAEYDKFLSENKVIKETSDAEMISRVGQRISVAAERWLDANNHQGYLKDYEWEYNLVEDESVNAWCMPGGKIVFYTGILPVAKNEAGIAAIMGHEVAHALANHGQQRMSAGMIQQGVGAGVAIATRRAVLTMLNKLNHRRLIHDNRHVTRLARLLKKKLIQTKENQPGDDKMEQRYTQNRSRH